MIKLSRILVNILATGAVFPYFYPANAASITNLSGIPQTLHFDISEGGQAFTVAPQETWRTPGEAWIIYNNREVHMNDIDEFALWPDGSFGPQWRNSHGTGNISQ